MYPILVILCPIYFHDANREKRSVFCGLATAMHHCIYLQTMSISMYFGVSWLDPRLRINETAVEWREVKTGPKDVRIASAI